MPHGKRLTETGTDVQPYDAEVVADRKKREKKMKMILEQIRQDGMARVSTLSKQAMRDEIARVVRQGWLDRVAPLIGLSKQARQDGVDAVVRLARQERVARIIRLSEQARRSAKIG